MECKLPKATFSRHKSFARSGGYAVRRFRSQKSPSRSCFGSLTQDAPSYKPISKVILKQRRTFQRDNGCFRTNALTESAELPMKSTAPPFKVGPHLLKESFLSLRCRLLMRTWRDKCLALMFCDEWHISCRVSSRLICSSRSPWLVGKSVWTISRRPALCWSSSCELALCFWHLTMFQGWCGGK